MLDQYDPTPIENPLQALGYDRDPDQTESGLSAAAVSALVAIAATVAMLFIAMLVGAVARWVLEIYR